MGCLLLREERGREGRGGRRKGWEKGGEGGRSVREGGICVIGFRGMDATDTNLNGAFAE